MDTAYSFGLTEPNTKGNGKITKPVEKEISPIPTATHMKVNGKATKPMDSEFISMPNLKPSTKATGNTI